MPPIIHPKPWATTLDGRGGTKEIMCTLNCMSGQYLLSMGGFQVTVLFAIYTGKPAGPRFVQMVRETSRMENSVGD